MIGALFIGTENRDLSGEKAKSLDFSHCEVIIFVWLLFISQLLSSIIR